MKPPTKEDRKPLKPLVRLAEVRAEKKDVDTLVAQMYPKLPDNDTRYAQTCAAIVDDPAAVIIRQASMLMVIAEQVAARTEPDGSIVIETTIHRHVARSYLEKNGVPIKDVRTVMDNTSERRRKVAAVSVLADIQLRIATLIEKAAALAIKEPPFTQININVLTPERMAQILKERGGDAGALSRYLMPRQDAETPMFTDDENDEPEKPMGPTH